MANKRQFLKKNIYFVIVTLHLLVTVICVAILGIKALEEENVTEITFDLALGNVALTDNKYIGVIGLDENGEKVVVNKTIDDNCKYRFIITQSNYSLDTTTRYVVSVGTAAKGVTKDFEIHLKSLNIDPHGNVGKMFVVNDATTAVKEQPHAPSVYVNNELGSTVYLILDNATESFMKGYAQVFGDSATNTGSDGQLYASTMLNEVDRFGHAAIEKEINTNVAEDRKYSDDDRFARGTLVVTCERGFEKYKNNSEYKLKGHTCKESDNCGRLNATAVGEAGFRASTSSNTRTGAAAAIGSKAEVSSAAHKEDNLANAITRGTLHNLVIAGGKINAVGATGNWNKKNDKRVFLGGSPGIGVGAGFQQYSIGYDLNNLCITGGLINSIAGDGSSANIGGGYHSGYVWIYIYGGKINATDQLTDDHTQEKFKNADDMKRGPGIGGGGGGATSNATKGAYIEIHGGDITAYSSYGAAVGTGGGGDTGSARKAYILITDGVINARTTKGFDADGDGISEGDGAGAAIGSGGSLGTGSGGAVEITITGGNIQAYSEGGADIGGGGTNSKKNNGSGGSATLIEISGGTINTTGGGIGGGKAFEGTGGAANIKISGGTINSTSIGGGDCQGTKPGGKAEVEVSGTAHIFLTGTIGGGSCIRSTNDLGHEICYSCHGDGLCSTCGGDAKCASCDTKEEQDKLDEQNIKCPSCNGTKKCQICIKKPKKCEHCLGDKYCDLAICDNCIGRGAGGEATVTVNSGYLHCQDIGGGNAQSGNGGAAKVIVGGGTLIARSIGGGTSVSGKIGYATAQISGGDITGQFIMAAGGSKSCTFTMSDGRLFGVDASVEGAYTKTNGGAIYMDDSEGVVNISGGIIENCKAQNGGAIYMTAGKVNISNDAIISNCSSTDNGGAIYLAGTGKVNVSGGTIRGNYATNGVGGAAYLGGGTLTINGGTLTDNHAVNGSGGVAYVQGGDFVINDGTVTACTAAQNGGAVYVSGGNATITGGTLLANKAEQNGGAICIEGGSFTISGGMIQGDNNHALADAQLGGAVYVSGGNAHVNGGTLSGCSANSGGAIYVNGGTVTMLGGEITGNKATAGNGGAIYVTGTTNLSVMVRSGEISGNSASANGGAICVQGVDESTNTITVQIGVNELHYTADGTPKDCDHTGNMEGLGNCPIVKNNVCDSEGGAIYIAGTDTTNLNIYCITEEGNRGAGNVAGGAETSLSDFLKVDGGKVLISATNAEDGVYYGDSNINSSIHVTGGDLQLSGTLSNPAIFAPITVDVVAKGGSYTDQRKNDEGEGTKQYYVVKYFENFKVGYGDDVHATGQYKVNQMLITESHTVWGVIYSYTGYTIVGWNTKDDGTGTTFEVSSKIDYEDSKEYMEGITLELYAIWSKDYYWIQFEPNVDVFSGGMGNEDKRVSFDCAGQTLLPENGYVNLGYRFLGWSTDPNTNEVKYTNNQTIAALSQTFGDIITLYAVWIDCDHSNDEWYVYTGSGDSVTCTCLCSYFVTATLVAPKNAVYNGSPHPAKPTFTNNSNNEFNEAIAFVGWKIAYTYTPFEIDYTTDKVVTDAGYYTAILMYKGATAKLDFTIAKGTQNAPATPTFTTGMTDGQGYLLVDQTGTTETKINYVLEYTKKDANGQASQHTIDPDSTYTEGIRFNDFDSSWTLYYVVAWYSGNNNYEESAHVKSKQTYIYKGKINIVIIDESNMQTSIIEDTENDRVSLVSNILNNDWYISGDYNASASGTLKKDEYADIVMENVFLNYFERSVTPVDGKTQFAYVIKNAFDDGYSGTIEIRFTGVKQAPTVSASGTPNEVFGDVTDTVTEISLDSAFTAYFEIEYFVDGVYASPVLRFGTALPSGTTIILIDKSNGSYWYKTIEASTGTVAITEFLPMRGTGTLSAESKLLKYQFIVDFSDVATPLSAGAFSVSLSYTIKNDTYAPEISAEKSITLKSITNTVGVPRVNVNSATVSVNYAQGAEASKWSEKELSLVLIPENLLKLPDASILVEQTIGDKIKTTVCERNPDGMFIVAMDPDAEFIKITLQSQMFKAETEYEFSMQIYSAYAGSAPMNGTKIGPTQTLTLYPLVAAQNAVKIEVIDNQVIYTYDDTINAKIFASVGTGYKATVTLLRKNSDGKYESTGWSQEWKPDDETSNYQTILIENIGESFGEGMYCISVVVRDEKTGTAVMTVPYYLIIQK